MLKTWVPVGVVVLRNRNFRKWDLVQEACHQAMHGYTPSSPSSRLFPGHHNSLPHHPFTCPKRKTQLASGRNL